MSQLHRFPKLLSPLMAPHSQHPNSPVLVWMGGAWISHGHWVDRSFRHLWLPPAPNITERSESWGLSEIRNETQVYIFSTWYIPKKVKLLLHESKKLGSSKAKEEWRDARWRPPSHSSIQYSAARARPRCHAHSGVITDSYLHLGCSWAAAGRDRGCS